MHIFTKLSFFSFIFSLILLHPIVASAQEQTEYTRRLIVEMNGENRFYIEQPNGDRSGSWRFDYDFDAANIIDKSLQSKYQAIVLGDPQPGTYVIETDNRFPGIYTSELSFTYIDPENQRYGGYTGDIAVIHNENDSFEFTLNAAGEEVISFDQTFDVVNQVQVFRTDSDTSRVTWQPSQGFTGTYRVYKKQHNADFDYSIVGETSSSELITDIDWGSYQIATGVISKYASFVVSHVYPDGSESFLSNPAYNNDTDQDGFDDETETELGTDINNIDTDGDTLNDFFEVNIHNTDPTLADTDEDGFNDNIEIEAGTSPLDPNFFPSDDCANPGEGDWYINNDCDLEQDEVAPADIIIGNNSTLTILDQVTLWFKGATNKILIMIGSSINLQSGASIKSTN